MASELATRLREWGDLFSVLSPKVARDGKAAADALDARDRDVAELVAALEWYGEQARLARLIHSEGDAGRQALASDGGKRARETIAKHKGGARG